jgi:hypothetical protein
MNHKDQRGEAPTSPPIFTLPASSFIVVLGLDRLNEIFHSTLVPAFAKNSPLVGGDVLLETIVATAKLRSSPFPWSRMDDWSSGLPTYSLFAQAISQTPPYRDEFGS